VGEILLPRLRDQDDPQVRAVVIRAVIHKIRLPL